jgi:glycerol 2-dehydrogenase (NADP+)
LFIGTYGTEDEESLIQSIVHALKTGYRMIDTGAAYGVESVVGKAVRASGIPRSEITIITKLWINFHDDPKTALEIALQTLGLDYIDIFMMHWPCSQTRDMKPLQPGQSPTFVEAWKKMEALVGPTCKSLGVSNFTQKTLEKLLENATIVPVVNQVELHAFNPNLKLVPYCQSKGIHVISWR